MEKVAGIACSPTRWVVVVVEVVLVLMQVQQALSPRSFCPDDCTLRARPTLGNPCSQAPP
jgi:hypothetical protein